MNLASRDEALPATSHRPLATSMIWPEYGSAGRMEDCMKRILAITAPLLLVAFGLTDAAWAQIPQYTAGPQTGGGGPSLKRSTRPVVSPYTGLLGAGVGSNSGIGYQFFTRVQPQVSANRALGSLGRSVNRLQATQSLASGGLSNLSAEQQLLLQQQATTLGIGPTGHPVAYMSHSVYFGTNMQRGGAGGAGFGTTGGASSGGGYGASTSTNPSLPVRR
jgi:hypothetical protein